MVYGPCTSRRYVVGRGARQLLFKVRVGVRAIILSLLAYLFVLPLPSAAQGAVGGFSTLPLPGGLAITLPQTWRPVDAVMERQVSATLDTILPQVKDSLLQASLSHGKPVQILNATDGDNSLRTLNLNAAPAPGASPATFANASEDELATALGPLCRTIGQMLTQVKGRLISCSRAERLFAGGRAVALTRYLRTGPSGFVSVWLVQYPDDNAVYSLTLSAPQADESTAEPVFRGIWESLQFGQR
jgi:hypothetical protein